MSKVLVLIPCYNEKVLFLKIIKKIKQKLLLWMTVQQMDYRKIKKLKNKNFAIISNKKIWI